MPGGWFVLAQKLRDCGIEPREGRIDAFEGKDGQGQGSLEAIPSFKQGSVSEEVLLHGGVNSFNNCCLVGKWGDVLEEGPLLSSLED